MFKLLRLLIIVVLIVGAGALFLPLGSVEYKDPEVAGTLRVPSFSILEQETLESDGKYKAEFKSVRSQWALEQEFERIMKDNYVETVCSDGKSAHLDEKNQVIVYSYDVQQGVPFSVYSVVYVRGGSC